MSSWFSYLYFGGMVLRYVIWMWRRPDQRWFGGTIPIIFHCVVAAFLFTFGTYHVRLAVGDRSLASGFSRKIRAISFPTSRAS